MKKKFLPLLTFLTIGGLILSCGTNIFRPFTGEKSTEDILEEAQKCLHDNDYSCAISKYQTLPAGTLKNQKLCIVRLAQGGLTIKTLVNIVGKNENTVLGQLADTLVPWSAEKQAALDAAKTDCVAYADAGGGDFGTLVKTLALMTHCASLLAKTDLLVGNSEADAACTTAGNNSGNVRQNDISDSSGNIGTAGMCSLDVGTCRDDIVAIPVSALEAAGLSGIKNAYDQVPSALKDSSAVITSVRSSLRTTVLP